MGTSQSSKGSPPNQPMVPPWTPEVPPPEQEKPVPKDTPKIASPSRFKTTKLNMTEFVRSGDDSRMKKGCLLYTSPSPRDRG